jgi:hypothetical protein
MRSLVDCLARIAVFLDQVGRDVARYVLVHEVLRPDGFGDADDGGQDLVGDADAFAHVLGDVAVSGNYHGHRFTDVVNLVASKAVGGAWVRERGVRDQ